MVWILRVLALLGVILIIGTNELDVRSLFALIFIPFFFIGKPWYRYFSKKIVK